MKDVRKCAELDIPQAYRLRTSEMFSLREIFNEGPGGWATAIQVAYQYGFLRGGNAAKNQQRRG